MLDDEDRIARIAQLEEQVHEPLHIQPMQARCRLIEDIERLSLLAFAQFECELDTLGLAAGERRRGLPELDVTEADIGQRAQLLGDARLLAKDGQRFVHAHGQRIGDAVALEAHVQGFAVVALPAAAGTLHIDVGHKLHIKLDHAVALATLAAPAAHVEAEPAGLVAPDLREGALRIEQAQLIEELGEGRRIRARAATDRSLVDLDHRSEVVEPLNLAVLPGNRLGAIQLEGRRFRQNVVDEGALPRAGNPADDG